MEGKPINQPNQANPADEAQALNDSVQAGIDSTRGSTHDSTQTQNPTLTPHPTQNPTPTCASGACCQRGYAHGQGHRKAKWLGLMLLAGLLGGLIGGVIGGKIGAHQNGRDGYRYEQRCNGMGMPGHGRMGGQMGPMGGGGMRMGPNGELPPSAAPSPDNATTQPNTKPQ